MITRDLIIKKATELFVEHGVKSITISKIVNELHTSKRTIYNHFEDKPALLKAVLAVYHAKIKAENEAVLDDSENVIEAMGRLLQKIIQRSHQVNPSFFNDILHYYPGLLNESYQETGNFAHQEMIDMARWGKEDGVFVEDLDIEVVGKTVLAMLKMLKDNAMFPVSKYSKERLTFGMLVPYLKGLCTPKGLELVEIQEELFRITI
ncbi:MAG: AcrR family transcriptional regulator [Paraglaciecola sp.]|jgi:AcrR family transcriptional regulator